MLGFDSYLYGFALSFLLSGSICLFSGKLKKFGMDSLAGPQKLHQGSIPRIGGLAIFVGILANMVFMPNSSIDSSAFLMGAVVPVFLIGVMEDFTGSVSPWSRLLVSLAAGGFFCGLTGYTITNVGIDIINPLLDLPLVSFAFTSIAFAAMVNALNIVDGLNGLAGSVSVFMLFSFGILSSYVGNHELQLICFLITASCIGFLFWNFPLGKIFLGDGGAYFLGAFVGGVSIMLPEQNDSISPFSSFLIVIYPVYELMRSSVRRLVSGDGNAMVPDDKHLHSMLFKLIALQFQMARFIQNSLASLITMVVPLFCCVWAVIFYQSEIWLVFGVCFFVVFYEVCYLTVARRLQQLGSA